MCRAISWWPFILKNMSCSNGSAISWWLWFAFKRNSTKVTDCFMQRASFQVKAIGNSCSEQTMVRHFLHRARLNQSIKWSGIFAHRASNFFALLALISTGDVVSFSDPWLWTHGCACNLSFSEEKGSPESFGVQHLFLIMFRGNILALMTFHLTNFQFHMTES